ncbi:MAG TPA: hypothetical protein VMV83_03225 [Rectinemataceae bacterium]|nr:hypothetical protein [Rectinemataceae bacterium]
MSSGTLSLGRPTIVALVSAALVDSRPIRLGLFWRSAIDALRFREGAFAAALPLVVPLALILGLGFLPRRRVLSGITGPIGPAGASVAPLSRILRPLCLFGRASMTAATAPASPPVAPAFGAASSRTLGLLAFGFLIASFV